MNERMCWEGMARRGVSVATAVWTRRWDRTWLPDARLPRSFSHHCLSPCLVFIYMFIYLFFSCCGICIRDLGYSFAVNLLRFFVVVFLNQETRPAESVVADVAPGCNERTPRSLNTLQEVVRCRWLLFRVDVWQVVVLGGCW